MQEPADIWKPALIAGALFGTASGIPLLGILNCACCSLIVGAGVLTVFLMVRGGGLPVTWGRAALGGGVAGAIAAPVHSMTDVLMTAALGMSLEEKYQQSIDQAARMMPAASEAADMLSRVPVMLFVLLGMLVSIVVFAPFGALGGVIGRALFEKRPAPGAPAGSPSGPPSPPPLPPPAPPTGPDSGGS